MNEVQDLFYRYFRASTRADLLAVEREAQSLAQKWQIEPTHVCHELLTVLWQIKRSTDRRVIKALEAKGISLAAQLRVVKR